MWARPDAYYLTQKNSTKHLANNNQNHTSINTIRDISSKLENSNSDTITKIHGIELVKMNYRHVSNLPYISKLVEKAMLEQINLQCNTHSLLPDYQSAYRENRSCKTVLLKHTNDLLWSMERNMLLLWSHLTYLQHLTLSNIKYFLLNFKTTLA